MFLSQAKAGGWHCHRHSGWNYEVTSWASHYWPIVSRRVKDPEFLKEGVKIYPLTLTPRPTPLLARTFSIFVSIVHGWPKTVFFSLYVLLFDIEPLMSIDIVCTAPRNDQVNGIAVSRSISQQSHQRVHSGIRKGTLGLITWLNWLLWNVVERNFSDLSTVIIR